MSSAERCLEDHEVVLEVQASWSIKSDTRFVFCKNYAKYEFFRKPTVSSLQRVLTLNNVESSDTSGSAAFF